VAFSILPLARSASLESPSFADPLSSFALPSACVPFLPISLPTAPLILPSIFSTAPSPRLLMVPIVVSFSAGQLLPRVLTERLHQHHTCHAQSRPARSALRSPRAKEARFAVWR